VEEDALENGRRKPFRYTEGEGGGMCQPGAFTRIGHGARVGTVEPAWAIQSGCKMKERRKVGEALKGRNEEGVA